MINHTFSYWEKAAWQKPVDLIIVGAGLTGLITALYLIENSKGLRIRIVDRLPVGAAASSKNAGFVCFGSLTELEATSEKFGQEAVLRIVLERRKGMQLLVDMIAEEHMAYRREGGTEWIPENYGIDTGLLVEKWNDLLGDHIPGPVFNVGNPPAAGFNASVYCEQEASIDPAALLRYLESRLIGAGVQMIRGLGVKRIEKSNGSFEVVSESGLLFRSNAVLLAGNGFLPGLIEGTGIRPARNIVMVSKELPELRLRGNYHVDRGFIYFRQIGQRLLIGGGRNWAVEAEETDRFGINADIKERLTAFARKHIAGAEKFVCDMAWSGIMGMRNLEFGPLQRSEDGLFVTGGYSGMGVALCNLYARNTGRDILHYFDKGEKIE